MMATVTELLVKAAVESVLAKTTDLVTGHAIDELEALRHQLNSIEDKIESAAARHLRAAVLLYRTGDYEEAVRELIKAVSIDENAAYAHYCLGVALLRRGKTPLALEHLRYSVQLNNFIGVFPELVSQASDRWVESDPKPRWERAISPMHSRGGPATLKTLLVDFFGDRRHWSSAAILHGACGGLTPVVQIRIGSDLLGVYNDVITVHDPETGELRWSQVIDKSKLFFATPRFIVLRVLDGRGGYELRDIDDGRSRGRYGSPYFEATFCGSLARLTASSAFSRTIAHLSDPEIAYGHCTRYYADGWGPRNFLARWFNEFGGLNHYGVTWAEGKHFSDAWKLLRYSLTDLWKHACVPLPPHNWAHRLHCTATISRSSTTRDLPAWPAAKDERYS